ncbi:glycosyltransferase [Chryseobacterium sp. Hurlbut01]|uniref:glycosyltransferase n=1 Tax=Chryseobacterium sp. Hurlbut01 TaxID=1681828 RepID=UPI000A460E12|nr:glycosyltransferase [Chryseobacterium sp. Hurlbut01]
MLWIVSILSRKKKNSVIVESSIYESKTKGIKSWIKKIFLKRISKAYASGRSQIKLLQALNFKGKIIKTKGVGIFNISPQPPFEKRSSVVNFLYVGRLSKEKNLERLIKVFGEFPELILHIIGFGPDEIYLKSISSENIKFIGAVKNTELYKFYQYCDVFILPSVIEPWGLVVEEALNNGMPVIISNKVGCGDEIVKDGNNGLIFRVDDESDMKRSILKIRNLDIYNNFRKNISEMNFEEIVKSQIDTYITK